MKALVPSLFVLFACANAHMDELGKPKTYPIPPATPEGTRPMPILDRVILRETPDGIWKELMAAKVCECLISHMNNVKMSQGAPGTHDNAFVSVNFQLEDPTLDKCKSVCQEFVKHL